MPGKNSDPMACTKCLNVNLICIHFLQRNDNKSDSQDDIINVDLFDADIGTIIEMDKVSLFLFYLLNSRRSYKLFIFIQNRY